MLKIFGFYFKNNKFWEICFKIFKLGLWFILGGMRKVIMKLERILF